MDSRISSPVFSPWLLHLKHKHTHVHTQKATCPKGSVQDFIESNQIQCSKPYNSQDWNHNFYSMPLKLIEQEMDRLRAIADAHYMASDF